MSKYDAIRRLTIADVHDYRAIRLAALCQAPDAFSAVHDIEALRPMSEHRARLVSSIVWGAYRGTHITGMIGLKQEEGQKDRHKAFLWGFYVEPDGRGCGVGASLMSALLEAAHEIVEQVTLTVVQDNLYAIALYERSGFTRYGIEPRALKTDAGYADEVLMIRFLDR